MTDETFFHLATGFAAPRAWQAELAASWLRTAESAPGLGTLARDMVRVSLAGTSRAAPIIALSSCSMDSM